MILFNKLCSAARRTLARKLLLVLFGIVAVATPAGLLAQSFPAPGAMTDFTDPVPGTPDTAMVIEPSDPVTENDDNTVGPPASGENTTPPGGVPLGMPDGPAPDIPTVGGDNYEGPVGVSGIFNGNSNVAGSLDPLTHCVHRQIDDIVVPGSVGKYPLKMTRYYNSRSNYHSGWTHEYSWGMSSRATKVYYPNGSVHEDRCGDPKGVSDGWEARPAPSPAPSAGTGTWRLADGGRVHFDHFQVTWIKDPYDQTTNITYDSNSMKVTEPGGRYLKFNYITDQWGNRLLDNVEAYDGPQNHLIERVRYTYTWQATGGQSIWRLKMLSRVDYDDSNPNDLTDNTHAHYTYRTDNVPNDSLGRIFKDTPLLATCQDTRYNGTMRQIAYDYYQNTPHGVVWKEKRTATGSAVTRIEPEVPLYLADGSYPMPTEFTETRGDGPARTFHYTRFNHHSVLPARIAVFATTT
jgi:hypothetical protein